MSAGMPCAFSRNRSFEPGTAWQERRGRFRVRSDMAGCYERPGGADQTAGVDEPIEVEVRRVGEEPAAEVEREPSDWRRWIVPLCAVVGALSLVVVAWSQVRLASSSERSTCLQETQYVSFGPGSSGMSRDEFLERVAACGVELPEDD